MLILINFLRLTVFDRNLMDIEHLSRNSFQLNNYRYFLYLREVKNTPKVLGNMKRKQKISLQAIIKDFPHL